MNPLVSILIPCYNAEEWIEQAIDSALHQTYNNIEVIVIDDGSTDNSLEMIKSFDGQIFWSTSSNHGGNFTRNCLLELSKGEWLQYLDSDDYLFSDKIARQVEFLTQNPEIDIVYSPIVFQHQSHVVETTLKNRENNNRENNNRDNRKKYISSPTAVLNLESPNDVIQEVLPIPQPHDPWVLLARWYLPQTGSPLWRKQAIVDVGGWKEKQICCQEHELYLRLLQGNKKFGYFGVGGSVYRQWSETTVCKKNQAQTYRRRLEITDKLEQHLQKTQQLTELRRDAINQARFECARIIWLTDKCWAKEIIQQIRNQDLTFVPFGSCAPEVYRLMYQFLGFDFAETLAAFKRSLAFS